jgi:IS605 OrfB family transposase
MGRFSKETVPHRLKTLKFWVVGLSKEDEALLEELGEALRICHKTYFEEALRLTVLAAPEERASPTERLRLARRAAQAEFEKYGFYMRFGNTYTGEVADKDLAKQMKDYDVAVKNGGTGTSFSLMVKRCNPDFLVGLQCEIESVPTLGDSPDKEAAWVMTGAKLKKDESAEIQESRRWGLIPQVNRSRKNAMGRAKRTLAEMESALKITRVRLIRKSDGKKTAWEAQVVIWTPMLEVQSEEAVVCAIDLGMNNLAVATIPSRNKKQFFGRKDVSKLWLRHDEIDRARKALYKQGKRNARKVKGDKLSRLRRHINELISRRIVDWCVLNRVTHVAMEDLSGIRRTSSDPVWNARLSRWPFFHLQQRIEQKLHAAGIEYKTVLSKNNSITCSECGTIDKKNREGGVFSCVSCGFAQHADVVGADNAAKRLEKELEERKLSA